uniref:Ninein like n=1 Tax=Latimeria chalumnae TaxID=7897 RepID=H3A0K8_LATCH
FGMDEAEENKYVSQLKEVFDSCDTTGTGYLDKEELTELCHKLHLEAQLPVLLQILLGTDHYARVNFEEFKEGFVAVLSSTIEFSTSDEDSSYLEPVISSTDEVKPKYIKGTKRYGRRTHPEVQDSEVETTGDLGEQLIHGTKKCQELYHGNLYKVASCFLLYNEIDLKSNRNTCTYKSTWPQKKILICCFSLFFPPNLKKKKKKKKKMCEQISLFKTVDANELDDLFINLDKDKDGRISLKEFQHGLFIHFPLSLPTSSTPFKQRRLGCLQQAFEEIQCRTASPSLLSNALGTHLFSSIDDGTGYVNAEQIVNIWKEEGIENSRKILETLDFTVEEKLNLAELTMALDNELMVSKNGIHQAVLASYKNEIHYLQVQVESTCKEKDKVKADLKKAEKCNLQLAKEVDERHAAIEHLNENKIKGLEQEYKEKTTAVLSEMDKERELIMQQVNTQRAKLETEIDSLRTEESHLREKLSLVMKENCRLQKELVEVVEKLSESEGLVSKLQKDLNYMLKEKLSMVDPQNTELFNQEERFAEIIKEYVLLIRELRDQNDELQSELEVLRSQLQERRPRRLLGTIKDKPVRIGADGRIIWTDSDSGAKSPDLEPTKFSIETELMVEQLKEQHQQKVQDLKIQLETKVNYYEREIELMKRNFEKERKDVEQSFKIEISELEEQKADLEEQSEKLQGLIDELRDQLQRKETEAELRKRLAQMESQYTENQKVLMKQHQCEQKETEQRCSLEKEKLKFKEKMNEEQDKQETELIKKNNLIKKQKEQLTKQEELNEQLFAQLKSQEEELSLKNKREHELFMQLQQKEDLLHSVKQKHDSEVKEMENDLKKQKQQLEEKSNLCQQISVQLDAKQQQLILQLSSQLEAQKEKLLLFKKKQKEQDLPFQFQHSVCAACKQKTEYESNLRQRKRKEQAMLCQLQQQEAEADVRVQQIKEEVKKEKNQLKENLLELEDLVHTLENE